MERKASFANRSDSVESLKAATRKILSPLSSAPSRSRSSSAPMQPVETKALPSSVLATAEVRPNSDSADRGSRPAAGGSDSATLKGARDSRHSTSRSPDLVAAMANSSDAGRKSKECQIFEGLTYCGHCTVDAPISQTEANRSMNMLRKQPQDSMLVSVSVPVTCEGAVRLIDRDSGLDLTNYPVRSILFCARGTRENNARDCMAFTVAHRQGSGIFYCHVLKADDEDKIRQMLRLLGVAFKDNTLKQRLLQATEGRLKTLDYSFEVLFDLGEDDGKGNFLSVARDKDLFKVRQNLSKQVVLMISQGPSPLVVLRCFGILIGAGRAADSPPLHPIDMVQMKQHEDGKSYYVTGVWDTADSSHALLNQETAKGDKMFLTVAADLVFAGIADPVRFVRTLKLRVFRKNERFWISSRQPSMESFRMKLREVSPSSSPVSPLPPSLADGDTASNSTSEPGTPTCVVPSPSFAARSKADAKQTAHYEVDILEVVDAQSSLSLTGVSGTASTGNESPTVGHSSSPQATTASSPRHDSTLLSAMDRQRKTSESCDMSGSESDENDGTVEDDEPLASGSGHVDKHWSEAELANWSDLLAHWDGSGRPKQLTSLIRKRGVPEPLRGRVWEMLAGLSVDSDLLDNFRVLVTKESPQERIIQEDISRTYPAHDYFRSDGEGQQALYKISKAYSIYDREVGYCQGLSFLIAALVLHMPMEQAFGILVHLMYDYEVRDLFRNEFSALKLKLFQMNKLIEDHLPDLAQHLANENIETHMFASQWFLTLYSSKFPLHAVYRILDLFLSEGSSVIFQVGIALLKIARPDLLTLDFENILKYFRVQLPKKFSTEEQAGLLMRQVVSTKISDRKIRKYQKDYAAHVEAEALNCDPLERLKRLSAEQAVTIVRLEQENDVLATELVQSKVQLRTEMDEVERKVDRLSKQVRAKDDELVKSNQERKQIVEEFSQFKELYHQSLLEMNEFRERHTKEREEQQTMARELDERHQRVQHDLQQELMEVKTRFSNLHSRYKSAAGGRDDSGQTQGDQSSVAAVTEPSSADATADSQRSSHQPAANSSKSMSMESFDEHALSAEQRCRELEVQIAHYKLQLVEAECKIQDLQHSMRMTTPDSEQETSKVNRWLSKLR